MTTDAKNAADFAHKWLTRPGNDETLWVVARGRDTGVDITARVLRQAKSAPSRPEIAHDTLPAFPCFNQQNGRAVFVICQPDHVPTIQTTMQGTLGELRGEELQAEEKQTADDMFGVSGLEEKYLIDAQDQDPTGRGPDVMVIDHPHAGEWDNLGAVLEEAETYYTDNATA